MTLVVLIPRIVRLPDWTKANFVDLCRIRTERAGQEGKRNSYSPTVTKPAQQPATANGASEVTRDALRANPAPVRMQDGIRCGSNGSGINAGTNGVVGCCG